MVDGTIRARSHRCTSIGALIKVYLNWKSSFAIIRVVSASQQISIIVSFMLCRVTAHWISINLINYDREKNMFPFGRCDLYIFMFSFLCFILEAYTGTDIGSFGWLLLLCFFSVWKLCNYWIIMRRERFVIIFSPCTLPNYTSFSMLHFQPTVWSLLCWRKFPINL